MGQLQENSDSTDFDRGACGTSEREAKTTTDFSLNHNLDKNVDDMKKQSWYDTSAAAALFNFISLYVLGTITWGWLWCAGGDGWRWDGEWFRLGAVAAAAWTSGQLLQTLTGLPPLLAALLTGIFARNLNILDMRHFTHIDAFLRKVYPVIILGKASLGWDVSYMSRNWRRVGALGVIPWGAEVVAVAVCTHLLLGFPWTWGLLLGSIYASVSCAVVMPSVLRAGARARGAHARDWPQLVCTAGGTDTALSVGVFGLIHSYMFFETDDIYRYVKAALTLFAGVALGAAWGAAAGRGPHPRDRYVAPIRILFVLVGGLLGNFFTSRAGWGGTGGVAVLACNATAATLWARRGWPLGRNPAATAYRVLWAAFEPMLFAYTGTFFEMNAVTSKTMLYGVAILVICLSVRLAATALVCWDMSLKERIFVCCTWVPKSIVEAVLCPVAINTLMMSTNREHEMRYAEDLVSLIVQAILITTPVGFLLTHYLGPALISKIQKDCEIDSGSPSRKSLSAPQNEHSKL